MSRSSPAPPFLQRVFLRPGAELDDAAFPTSLPFVRGLDIRFETAVTYFVGENGSGKSTVLEAIAELCGLPVGGGGRNEIADLRAPHTRSELAPVLRAAFSRKPRDGYFFRAEFQAHFASLLEERRADLDFVHNPYARYGGRSLHTRSHGEAFLAMFASWLSPAILLTFPGASLLSFDGGAIASTRLEETSHYQITRGILESPERYWRQLVKDQEEPG